MKDKANKLGNEPVNTEMYFRQNGEASEHCPFDVQTYSGLTKRELFAAMAMQGIVSDPDVTLDEKSCKKVARLSVRCADALLEELSK